MHSVHLGKFFLACACLLLALVPAQNLGRKEPARISATQDSAVEAAPAAEAVSDADIGIVIYGVDYPEWFDDSLLDLPAELIAAETEGKLGLAVYFAQPDCPCCEQYKDVTFARPDVISIMRRYFRTIAVDILGEGENGLYVTDFSGQALHEREFARRQGVQASPTLVFYDRQGREFYRVTGYHSPYEFLTILDFLLGGHHRTLALADYQRRIPPRSEWFSAIDLHSEAFFAAPPYHLRRNRAQAERPLAVFFESADCPACDLLHAMLAQDRVLAERLGDMEVVQLDRFADTPVLTPDGHLLTAREWAAQLGISYSPSVIFYDRGGTEQARADSILGIQDLAKTVQAVSNFPQPSHAPDKATAALVMDKSGQ